MFPGTQPPPGAFGSELRGQKKTRGRRRSSSTPSPLRADAVDPAAPSRPVPDNNFRTNGSPRFFSRHGRGGVFERYQNIHGGPQPEMKSAPRRNHHHPSRTSRRRQQQQGATDHHPGDDDDDDENPGVAEEEFFDDVDVVDDDEEYENSDDEFFQVSVPFDVGAVHVQYFVPLVKLAIADDAPIGATPADITHVVLGAQLDLLVSQKR